MKQNIKTGLIIIIPAIVAGLLTFCFFWNIGVGLDSIVISRIEYLKEHRGIPININITNLGLFCNCSSSSLRDIYEVNITCKCEGLK